MSDKIYKNFEEFKYEILDCIEFKDRSTHKTYEKIWSAAVASERDRVKGLMEIWKEMKLDPLQAENEKLQAKKCQFGCKETVLSKVCKKCGRVVCEIGDSVKK